MNPEDRIRDATTNFINLLLNIGYSANDVINGMDEALDQFEDDFPRNELS